jgi:hypothetical protein
MSPIMITGAPYSRFFYDWVMYLFFDHQGVVFIMILLIITNSRETWTVWLE